MKKVNWTVLFLAFNCMVSSCLPDASFDDPGVCAIQCDSAYLANRFKDRVRFDFISAGNGQGEASGVRAMNLTCADAYAERLANATDVDNDGQLDPDLTDMFYGPVALYFMALTPILDDDIYGDETEESKQTQKQRSRERSEDQGLNPSFRSIPTSAVSFEPVVYGSVNPEQTNPQIREFFGDDATTLYRGIITSPDFWCSDACGVAKVEINPRCNTTVDVMLHSGSTVGTGRVIVDSGVPE